MKLKKILLSLVMAASIMGTVVMPVSAESKAEDFFVRANGGSVLSSVAIRKDRGGPMGYYARERTGTNVKWVHGVETVNLRGRTRSGTRCTDLAQRNTPGGGDMAYHRGYGSIGARYMLAVQYDDSNPYQYLDLRCRWTP